jgi:hypothetical protein
LEPDDVGNLIMLANVYAVARQWGNVASIRKPICRSMKKTHGCSLIEVDNVVQEFVAGEDLKPEFGGIVGVLDILASQIVDEDVDFINSDCLVDAQMSGH